MDDAVEYTKSAFSELIGLGYPLDRAIQIMENDENIDQTTLDEIKNYSSDK